MAIVIRDRYSLTVLLHSYGEKPVHCIFSFACAAFIICVTSSWVVACSCPPPPAPSPKKALADSTAVFLGKVVKVDRESDFQYRVTFEVETNFKAVKSKKVEVRTATESNLCGVAFTEGEVYLVYCNGVVEALQTNNCTRTRQASRAVEDLKELGEGEAITE